jgi:hypothetical protein
MNCATQSECDGPPSLSLPDSRGASGQRTLEAVLCCLDNMARERYLLKSTMAIPG